jgi:aryl-alcohol dehydrogenase-like predicted oxidoreductase
MPSLRLGTAQWGLDYGITNSSGRISDSDLVGIVRLATECGIRLVDTAPAYGDAELRLGEVGGGFEIQTKVTGVQAEAGAIGSQIQESLTRLGRDSVESALVHDWSALSPEERAATRVGLVTAQALDLIDEMGVSLYEPRELLSLVVEFPEATVVQAPASVLDHRFLKEFRAGGNTFADVRFQARSVFLQGALLSASDQLPFGGHLAICRVREVASKIGFTPVELSLAFVRSQPEIDEVVLGVTSESELAQLLTAWEKSAVDVDWSSLESSDLELLDPRKWTRPI